MIRFLPAQSRIPTERVAVRFARATDAYCQKWDREVQPAIDSATERRPDYGWRWSRESLLLRANLSLAEAPASLATVDVDYGGYAVALRFLAGLSGQRAATYALAAAGPTGVVPLAMALVVNKVVLLGEPHQFLWLLSGAPDSVTINAASGFARKEDAPGKVGAGLMFSLLWRGVMELGHASLLLHASPLGGQRLLDIYAGWGMEPVPQSVPISPSRPNDGRYLRFTEAGGQAFIGRCKQEFL